MKDCRDFYIDGQWVSPTKACDFKVINPANEEPIATDLGLGTAADVNQAIDAARRAFGRCSENTVGQRVELLQRIIEVYQSKIDEMAGWPRLFRRK